MKLRQGHKLCDMSGVVCLKNNAFQEQFSGDQVKQCESTILMAD